MGYLYRPKLKGSTKEDPRFGRIWWVKYYVNGRPIRESTGTEKETEAKRFLKVREGRVAMGQPVLRRMDRIRYEEAAEDLRKHYQTTGRRSPQEAEIRLKHLDRFFCHARLASIDHATITRYVETRQQAGAGNATINRELGILGRMLRLAYEGGKLFRVPSIKLLKEPAPRKGFFEQEEYEAVCRRLPSEVQSVVTFAHITGWRVPSEILLLIWAQVDFRGGVVLLEPGTTKNRDARTFPMFPELRALLEAQREYTEKVQRERGCIVPGSSSTTPPWKSTCAQMRSKISLGPPRQGFFEQEEYEAVCRRLPSEVQSVVTFAHITGWRVPSEVLLLTWAQVDFRGGVVRLEPGTTKNRDARTFPMFPELRAQVRGASSFACPRSSC